VRKLLFLILQEILKVLGSSSGFSLGSLAKILLKSCTGQGKYTVLVKKK